MGSQIGVAVVGIGGYGQIYLEPLIQDSLADVNVKLIAAVDPRAEDCRLHPFLVDRDVPVFASLDAMYEAGVVPDLVVLASPLHLHAEQAVRAMESGSHVLCEKPLAASPSDAARMICARDATGQMLSVGFQWSFSPVIRRLKADLSAGRFGRAVSMRTKVYWPRARTYYTRNGWAGRLQTSDGRKVFDSPVNNACAHFLHNMLDLLGDSPTTADWPAEMLAETYRANRIENYDTAVFRCTTHRDVELFAAVSHVTERLVDPQFEYVFEHGRIISDASTDGRLIAIDADGQRIDYGSQPTGSDLDKFWSTVESIRTGEPPACSAESAMAHIALTTAVQKSGRLVNFGDDDIRPTADGRGVYVPGLEADLDRCYASRRLPSELGLAWGRPGRPVRMPKFETLSNPADAAVA